MVIAYVNGVQYYNQASADTITAPTASHTSGNLLVVIVTSFSGTATNVASITDTAGNTYTRINGAIDASSDAVEIWYAKNINGGNNSVLVTYNAPYAYRGVHVLQYSGCDITAPLDQSAVGIGNSTAPATANVTTTVTDEVLVAGDSLYYARTHTAVGNYLIRTILGGTEPSLGDSEDWIVFSIGTYNASYTIDSACAWAMVMATFKVAAPPGNWFLLQARNELQGIRGING